MQEKKEPNFFEEFGIGYFFILNYHRNSLLTFPHFLLLFLNFSAKNLTDDLMKLLKFLKFVFQCGFVYNVSEKLHN